MHLSPLDDLARQVAERPGEVAIASRDRTYTFAELSAAVGAVAARLSEGGIAPGYLVAVDLPAALEWIVDLALLRLATIGASIRGVLDTSAVDFDACITSPGGRVTPAGTVFEIDEAWISDAVSRASAEAPIARFTGPESICRLMLTSGTTGTPRAVAYAVGSPGPSDDVTKKNWTDQRLEVNFMGLSTAGGLQTALVSLVFGQRFVAVDHINERALRFVAQQGVQVLCAAPAQVSSILALLVQHDITLPSLTQVRIAGAVPSRQLLELIESRLGVPVVTIYGSTEGGAIAGRLITADADDTSNVGRILPGVEVQVLDESGKQVAAGVEGQLRYRGPDMVAGYFENRTAIPFGEWFTPGDTGMLTAAGELVITGRVTDVINLAGAKISPTRIEELATGFAGVDDAAVFEYEARAGFPQLAIAVVGGEQCDLRALDAYLRDELKVGHPTIYWRVAIVPRNRMGKIDRAVLAENYRAVAPRA